MKSENSMELNGVANALALLNDKNIEEAIIQLRLFAEYVRMNEQTPIYWHDFIKSKLGVK